MDCQFQKNTFFCMPQLFSEYAEKVMHHILEQNKSMFDITLLETRGRAIIEKATMEAKYKEILRAYYGAFKNLPNLPQKYEEWIGI